MIKVSKDQFDKYVKKVTWYPLTMSFPTMKEKTDFYGAEIGDDVMVVQYWNNDFCTSSFQIKDAQIVFCDGKYTVAAKIIDVNLPEIHIDKDNDVNHDPNYVYDEMGTPVMENIEPPKDEDIMSARLAAIDASDADDTFRISTPVQQVDEKPTILEEIKSVTANKASILDDDKPAPVVTRGREKTTAEPPKPVTKKVVVNRPPKQDPKPTYKQTQERKVNRPATPPPKPKFDFGDW